MKKIPTLFVRKFENHKVIGITDEITPGCEEAFKRGRATVKADGSCCAVIDGELYKRYDAKKGKTPPEGAIPCCDPDPVTGHWPHWVKVDKDNPADKWFVEAYNKYFSNAAVFDGTFEAVGPHFNGNPHELGYDSLYRHGSLEIDVDRDFESVSDYLNAHREEGLVFWLDDEPVCKIKRTDFGYEWPIKNKGEK
jgi:hypothetical protein